MGDSHEKSIFSVGAHFGPVAAFDRLRRRRVGKPEIVVGSKNFTESLILGEMYALALENAGYEVERKLIWGDPGRPRIAEKRRDRRVSRVYRDGSDQHLADAAQIGSGRSVRPRFENHKEKFNLVWLDPADVNDSQGLVTTRKVAKSTTCTPFPNWRSWRRS